MRIAFFPEKQPHEERPLSSYFLWIFISILSISRTTMLATHCQFQTEPLLLREPLNESSVPVASQYG